MACLGKQVFFHAEFCEFWEKRILKVVIFHWVKRLSKSNQTWHAVSPLQVDSRTKRIFAIACLVKKVFFHTELFEFREKGILKRLFFIGSMSFPNQTKLGMKYPMFI